MERRVTLELALDERTFQLISIGASRDNAW